MTKDSDILSTLHATLSGLHKIGVVDKATMRNFEAIREMPDVREFSGDQIRLLRDRLNISQGVLATLINASPSSVQKWEQGLKRPSGPAMKLLNLLDRKGMDAVM